MAKNHITYQEASEQYPGFVVIVPHFYMFRTFDDNARVLSYLIESKLLSTKDGLLTASSNIDDILSTLNDHHVNYIYLSGGEIVDSNTFKDNAYYRYLELGKTLPLWYYNDSTQKFDIENKQIL